MFALAHVHTLTRSRTCAHPHTPLPTWALSHTLMHVHVLNALPHVHALTHTHTCMPSHALANVPPVRACMCVRACVRACHELLMQQFRVTTRLWLHEDEGKKKGGNLKCRVGTACPVYGQRVYRRLPSPGSFNNSCHVCSSFSYPVTPRREVHRLMS